MLLLLVVISIRTDKGSAIKVKVKVVAYFLLNLGILACRRRRRGVEKVKEELRRES